MLLQVTDLEPCRKPAFTAADMHTTQDSLSSSRAPPATALDCWVLPGDASKGFGCTKVPPEWLVSKPVELARAGGAAASCPVPQEGIGGADDTPPLLEANGLPAHEQGVCTCLASMLCATADQCAVHLYCALLPRSQNIMTCAPVAPSLVVQRLTLIVGAWG